jgi:hypothetical protein
MTMNDDLDIVAINRTKRIAILNCDCQIPVTDWFDKNGKDCSPENAIICVCGDDDHGWFTVDLEALKTVTVH